MKLLSIEKVVNGLELLVGEENSKEFLDASLGFLLQRVAGGLHNNWRMRQI